MSNATTTTNTNTQPATPAIDNGRKKKGPAFSKAEDVALVKACLGVTTNPTVDTNLTEEGLWSSVVEGFVENYENLFNRDVSSLKSHFNSISLRCQFFSASYAKVYAARKSGENKDDWYEQTCARYVDFRPANSGKAFGLKHVWDLLKVEEKWKPQFPKENSEVEVVGETHPRPVGKHQAKAVKSSKRKRPSEDEDSTDKESLEMVCTQQEIDRERNAISRLHVYQEKVMMTHAIMSVNMATLSDEAKYYYKKMQKKIVEEMKRDEEKEKEEQRMIENVVEDVEDVEVEEEEGEDDSK
ncbi:hypothetical protein INT45_008088 [Circinella minor]|uniref:No apical meristem-associated C-terminal domain-containing protein n=1 Tax=Circinella minor TaxID=1195481 RepID=A0A8H7RVW6_9FUNG|nr:hypothetical protein INT45_008088 [Circinella minor]